MMHFLLLAPIIALAIGLMIFNLINLKNKTSTKYLNKSYWLLIIIIGNIIGNIVYLALESEKNDDSD